MSMWPWQQQRSSSSSGSTREQHDMLSPQKHATKKTVSRGGSGSSHERSSCCLGDCLIPQQQSPYRFGMEGEVQGFIVAVAYAAAALTCVSLLRVLAAGSRRRGAEAKFLSPPIGAVGAACTSATVFASRRAPLIVRQAGEEVDEGRRQTIAQVLSLAPFLAVGGHAVLEKIDQNKAGQAAASSPIPASATSIATLETVRQLGAQASSLRQAVRNGQEQSRGQIVRGYEDVLLPLQAAMQAVAPSLPGLNEESRKQAELQPLLMKGHLLELQEAIDKGLFSEYVSKRTEESYPGGKVERELEEIEETTQDFLNIAAAAAAKR